MNDDTSSSVHTEKRRLAAIMFTDMVGFSRQMGSDEARTLRLLAVHNQVIEHAVATHQGHVIKTAGDGFLLEFPSVVHAVRCAQDIQAQFHTHNTDKEITEQIHVRIGLHEGDILVQSNGDVLGDGVNIASRLQTLAEPDTICISQRVYEEVGKKLSLGTVISLGRPKLKNIAPRFPVYALLADSPQGYRQTLRIQRLRLSHRIRSAHWAAVAGLLLIAGTIAAVRYLPVLLPTPQSPTRNHQSLPLPDKPSIVILPFVNMSEDPQQEYFSDGITEDITTDLSRISSLFVIARNSAFTYKGKAMKVQDVSREMGVRYVLEGSVRKADNQVRVTAQLIDATTGEHLWAERYDRPLQDIFALQDEIVQKIVTTLKIQLTLMEQGYLVRKSTANLEAYDYYLRGMESFVRAVNELNQAANSQARQMFEQALERDPTYAEAYASLGFLYNQAWVAQWSQDPQTLDRALELAQKAIALDDSLPRAHSLLGQVYWGKGQYERAIAEGQRAITLDPNASNVYALQAGILTLTDKPEEAIELMEKAMRLNPRYPTWYLTSLGRTYHINGRYEEEVATLKSALARSPNNFAAHVYLAAAYIELGREAEAKSAAAEAQRLNPQFSLEVWKQRAPYKDPAVLERTLAALRKAGLK